MKIIECLSGAITKHFVTVVSYTVPEQCKTRIIYVWSHVGLKGLLGCKQIVESNTISTDKHFVHSCTSTYTLTHTHKTRVAGDSGISQHKYMGLKLMVWQRSLVCYPGN